MTREEVLKTSKVIKQAKSAQMNREKNNVGGTPYNNSIQTEDILKHKSIEELLELKEQLGYGTKQEKVRTRKI